jgi:hypothetical protein
VYAYIVIANDGCELTCDRFWSVCVTLHGQKRTTLFNQFYTKLISVEKIDILSYKRSSTGLSKISLPPLQPSFPMAVVFGGSRIIVEDTRCRQGILDFFSLRSLV